jgi:hypothetical protein
LEPKHPATGPFRKALASVSRRVRLTDGEAVELEPGELLFARPGVKREAVALESPAMLFIVGGRPGESYSPPIWASDWSG